MKKINQNKNDLLNKFYFNGKIKRSKLNKKYPHYHDILEAFSRLYNSNAYKSFMFRLWLEKGTFKGVDHILKVEPSEENSILTTCDPNVNTDEYIIKKSSTYHPIDYEKLKQN